MPTGDEEEDPIDVVDLTMEEVMEIDEGKFFLYLFSSNNFTYFLYFQMI